MCIWWRAFRNMGRACASKMSSLKQAVQHCLVVSVVWPQQAVQHCLVVSVVWRQQAVQHCLVVSVVWPQRVAFGLEREMASF